jgi:hypothetical protein
VNANKKDFMMQKLFLILCFLLLDTLQGVAKPNCKAIDAAISAKEDFVEVALAKQAPNASTVSLEALEDYKKLVARFEASLPTTLPVAMLDYAGFKLRALAAAQNVDWQAIAATRDETHQNWAKIKLMDKAVFDLGTNNLASLDLALATQNAKWVDSSAQILLDSVDLIERQIKNPAKGACQ